FADLTHFEPARATATMSPGATIVTGEPAAGFGAPAGRPPKLPARGGSKQSNQQLVLLLAVGGGAAAVVLVFGLVLVFAFGLGKSPSDKKTVAKKPDASAAKTDPKAKPKPEPKPDPAKPAAPKTDPTKPASTPFIG